MRDIPAKQARIRDAARELFAKRGYEATTFAMIKNLSGAAIGSINHFFDNKLRLAADLYEEAARPLVDGVETALSQSGRSVDNAVRGAQAVYLDWATGHSENFQLLLRLDDVMTGQPEGGAEPLRQRLTKALNAWAERLHSIRRLTPSQLYAVVIVPTHFAATQRIQAHSTDGADWPELLADMAIAALTPPSEPKIGKSNTSKSFDGLRTPPLCQ